MSDSESDDISIDCAGEGDLKIPYRPVLRAALFGLALDGAK